MTLLDEFEHRSDMGQRIVFLRPLQPDACLIELLRSGSDVLWRRVDDSTVHGPFESEDAAERDADRVIYAMRVLP